MSKRTSAGFFKKYIDELPGVAAALTTALAIFLASLTLTPVRHWLFPTFVKNYPLLCFFKPRVDQHHQFLIVEVFFVNRTKDTITVTDLQKILDDEAKQTGQLFTPSIILEYTSDLGRVQSVISDETFNFGRGSLRVEMLNSNTVGLTVMRIEPYTVLKANITVQGREATLAPVKDDDISGLPIPFDSRKFQEEACHQH